MSGECPHCGYIFEDGDEELTKPERARFSGYLAGLHGDRRDPPYTNERHPPQDTALASYWRQAYDVGAAVRKQQLNAADDRRGLAAVRRGLPEITT
jgi:ribosome modulation factor